MTATQPTHTRCHCGRPQLDSTGTCNQGHQWGGVAVAPLPCACPDPYCPEHARCVSGHSLIILDDDPAFCPTCGHDVMPVGACRVMSR